MLYRNTICRLFAPEIRIFSHLPVRQCISPVTSPVYIILKPHAFRGCAVRLCRDICICGILHLKYLIY